MTPVPEPMAYVIAQLKAVADPRSSRDTVLITPGTQVPPIPEGMHVGETRRGMVITTNPDKIRMLDDPDERVAGEALFGYGRAQGPLDSLVVQALDAEGVPVAELVTVAEELPQAVAAAEACSPTGGRVEITTKTMVALRRMNKIFADEHERFRT